MIDVLFVPTGMEDAPRLSLDVNVSLTVAVWKRIPDCRWMENLVYNIYMYIMYIWAFSHIVPLPERVAQNFDFYAWRNLLVEYVVDSIEDGHVDMIALVEQLVP